jgi:methanogenic corrinoid protein MtbC1
MLAEIERGYPPSQAAKLALAGAQSGDSAAGRSLAGGSARTAEPDPAAIANPSTDLGRLESLRIQLGEALHRYDGTRAQELFDAALAEFTLNSVLRDIVLRCLSDIGDAWARGDMNVAEEHFASQLMRERLLALARDWDRGRGPRALLACPTGERHDIGLICLGLVLSRNGWRVTFLGPDTPISAIAGAVTTLEPDLIVLAATLEEWFVSITSQLRALCLEHDVLIGGSGATARVARATGASVLSEGPVEAALRIAGRQP